MLRLPGLRARDVHGASQPISTSTEGGARAGKKRLASHPVLHPWPLPPPDGGSAQEKGWPAGPQHQVRAHWKQSDEIKFIS